MIGKTKIVVLHLKELIYTGVFLSLGILFVILLVMMFSPKEKDKEEASISTYVPGKYTTSLEFNGNTVEVVVMVDTNEITAITLNNLDEAVATMYPLMEPALDHLSAQILEKQSLDNLSYSDDNKYTSLVLLNAITSCIEQASNIETE
ncbi:MAG: FMN-binding protein [Lachnospiraceae bacterium]